MFSKQTKTPPKPMAVATASSPALTAADASKGRPRVASLVSDGITIEGGVSGDGELQIDGIVRGDVRVARLTVGETGHVEGAVHAESVELRGRVVGSVTAKQVRLYGTAYVDGDITHDQLAMETGAYFQGRSLKFQHPVAQPAQDAPPAITGELIAPSPKPLV